MLAKNGAGPALELSKRETGRGSGIGNAEPFKPLPSKFQVIRADLVGGDIARACGITVRGYTPILLLCRKLLIEAGHNPDQPLEAFRGDTLCLKVRSIGEAARLRVRGDTIGFEMAPEERCPGASLVRSNGGGHA